MFITELEQRLTQPHKGKGRVCFQGFATGVEISTTTAGAHLGAIGALQALEAALPETAERLMEMIAELAAAGVEHRFAACQLLKIASSCMVRPNLHPPKAPIFCREQSKKK